MRKHLVGWVLAMCVAPLSGTFAQSSDDAAGDLPKAPARSERLDIYGAGMCHQCEWRPHAKVMAAQEQCGVDASGKARTGVFECGRSPACDPVCNFMSCESQ